MLTVNAYAAPSAGQPLTATSIERRNVGPNDVLIEIQYAGICHSDIHTVNGDWGPQPFPVVPGHEIVGVVAEVGADVTKQRVGDRVGVGCMVNPAGSAPTAATETNSSASTAWCPPTPARTATAPLPRAATPPTSWSPPGSSCPSPTASTPPRQRPLLCAGITTYVPLLRWGAGPGKQVAVVGLGGLGHMAVKIAHAPGAEVTVLSQSLKKLEDGLRLGADDYFATSDPDTFTELPGRFDLIINTISATLDLDAHLGLLAVDGTLVGVGAAPGQLAVSGSSLLAPRRSLAGSMIGGIAATQEMLDFCAEHGIASEVEVIPADYVNEAYERVLASDVRYRFVIDTQTLAQA